MPRVLNDPAGADDERSQRRVGRIENPSIEIRAHKARAMAEFPCIETEHDLGKGLHCLGVQ